MFEGEYKNDFKESGNEYYFKGNLYFKGEYKSGEKWNGEGFDENGKVIFKINNVKGFIKEYSYYINCKYGKVDEYNYLKYEGKYLNGDKHGKGKEYNREEKIIFEGEYLNGEKYGKRKEYNKDGEIIFEGEYFKGKRWNGKGKEDNEYGQIIFEGEYLSIDDENKMIGLIEFEGEYLKGKRWNGKGKEFDLSGNLLYEGEYLNGKKHGKGKEYNDRYLKVTILKVKEIGKRNEDIDGEYIEDIDENMDEKFMKHREMLIKGSKRKNKRILFAENDNEF